jgi:hypothetical protein
MKSPASRGAFLLLVFINQLMVPLWLVLTRTYWLGPRP